MNSKRKRLKIDLKGKEFYLKFLRIVPISDGVTIALPVIPGRDLHFSIHCGGPGLGVFHLKDQGEKVAAIQLQQLLDDLEALRSNPKQLALAREWATEHLDYCPNRNYSVLIVGAPPQIKSKLWTPKCDKIVVDLDQIKMIPESIFWCGEFPVKYLREVVLSAYVKLGTDEFLVFDDFKRVAVQVKVHNLHDVRMFLVPCDPTDITKSHESFKRILLDFAAFLPSLEAFLRQVDKYMETTSLQ